MIALLDRNDQLHVNAEMWIPQLKTAHIVTHEMILSEVLTYFSGYGAFFRKNCAQFIRQLRRDPSMTIFPINAELFDAGLDIYEKALDKEWSHVDYISFALMKTHQITQALAYDHHFGQAGFTALLRQNPD